MYSWSVIVIFLCVICTQCRIRIAEVWENEIELGFIDKVKVRSGNSKYYRAVEQHLAFSGTGNMSESEVERLKIGLVKWWEIKEWRARYSRDKYKKLAKKLFNFFDINADNKVCLYEFYYVLFEKYLKMGLTPEETITKIRHDHVPFFYGADVDIDGSHTYGSDVNSHYHKHLLEETSLRIWEFRSLVFPFSVSYMTRVIINQLLNYDKNKDYAITWKELSVIEALQREKEKMLELYIECDRNGDGKLKEFEIYKYQMQLFRHSLPSGSVEFMFRDVTKH